MCRRMPQSADRPTPPCTACLELAGFAAAQAMCCLFDRVPLVPMAFARKGSNHVTFTLLSGGTPAQIASEARRWLDANVDAADAAVVVCDAFITAGGVKRDALVIEGRSYGIPVSHLKIAVPYRAHHHPRGFAIHRPKFIVESLAGQDAIAFRDAFFTGVYSHDAGRRVWDACVDESW